MIACSIVTAVQQMTKIRFRPKYLAGIMPSQPNTRALVVINNTPALIVRGKLGSLLSISAKSVLVKTVTGPIAES